MKKTLTKISLALSLAVAMCSCGDDRSGEYFELTKENQWIYSQMKDCYLWGDSIKEPSQSNFFATGEQFFGKLLYKSDKASYYGSVANEDTYGMRVSLMRDPLGITPAKVYALIEYVEPLSAAANAGLERGMYISKINGANLNMGVSQALKSGAEKEIEVCSIVFDDETEEYVWSTPTTVILPASAPVEPASVLLATVIEGTRTSLGYIICNGFDNESAVEEINSALLDFAAAGVSNIILDLRYNQSRSLANAISIASSFVPAEKHGTLFCTLYKDLKMLTSETKQFVACEPVAANIPVYIITTERTEGICSALVRAIRIARGTTDVKVVGKTASGGNLLTETFASPYDFNINPVTALIYDAAGNALSPVAPDYDADEFADLKHVYPLGNRQEYIINCINYLIANGTMPE